MLFAIPFLDQSQYLVPIYLAIFSLDVQSISLSLSLFLEPMVNM